MLVNTAAFKLLGASRQDELIGRDVFGFIHPEYHSIIRNRISQAGQQEQPLPLLEIKFVRPDGSVVEAETSSTSFQFQGRPALMVVTRDITERKQAEMALANERALLQTLMNHLPVALYLKDTVGRITLTNPKNLFWFNATSEKEILGKTDFDFFPHEQAAGFYADEQGLMKSGQPMLNHEEKVTRPDGSTHWNLVSKVPLFDSTGRVTGLVGIGINITERKLVEASHARLAMAVEQASETIVITDTNGTILYVNPAFEKSTGYTCAEAIGQNPRMLKSGKQDAGFYHRMWEVLNRGDVWHGHFINIRKDGKPYEEDATISPVRDDTGAVINYVAVKRDVTNEVQLEAQFRQLQRMEAVGQLAGGVAHDFNNILAVIQIQAELLKAGGSLSPEQAALADEIGLSVQRASALTRQLLLFGRKQALQQNDLDLNQSINDMTKMLRRILGETIELQFKFAMQSLFVHADAGMLDQVLMNLAVNSRDAMPNGGRLVIETSAVDMTSRFADTPSTPVPVRSSVWALATPGAASRRKFFQIFSSLSSPPRKPAKAPASDCPPSSPLSGSIRAGSTSIAKQVKARPSASIFRASPKCPGKNRSSLR